MRVSLPSNLALLTAGMALAALLATPVAQAAPGTVGDLRINGTRVTATLDVGIAQADLTLDFQQALGLTPAGLGISVESIDPLDAGLLARLPTSANGVPAALPLKLTVAPPASGSLAFAGSYTLELYTQALHYSVGSPLRLFSASNGGDFHDITETNAGGSYRVRGTKGSFSEFLIVADLRLLGDVAETKLARLDALLGEHRTRMPEAVFQTLQGHVDAAIAAWALADSGGTISAVTAFQRSLADHAGLDVPDVWRSAGDIRNATGELDAAADTLRFSLGLVANAN